MLRPRCRQSIQPIVIGHDLAPRSSPARKSSMSGIGSLSTNSHGLDDALELELDLEDVAEQAHAADGAVEQLRLLRRAALDDAVVGEAHAERAHVRAEAAGDVVVPAVHVAGDHAAERDELGARRDRREEAARHEQRG